MKVMKLAALMACIGLVLIVLTACSIQSETVRLADVLPESRKSTSETVKTFIMLHSKTEQNPLHDAAQTFCDRLKENSGGSLTVNLFPDNTLGTRFGMADAVRDGKLDIRIGRSGSIEAILYELPLLYEHTDIEYLKTKLQRGSELYSMLEESCEKNNCRLLGVFSPEYRVLSIDGPINGIDDFKDRTIRITGFPLEDQLWKQLGFHTIDLDYSILHMALMENAADAVENTFSAICADKLYETQTDIVLTNFEIEINALFINLDEYNALSEQERSALEEAAAETIASYSKLLTQKKEEQMDMLAEKNVRVTAISPGLRAECASRVRDLVYDSLCLSYGKDYVDSVISAAIS